MALSGHLVVESSLLIPRVPASISEQLELHRPGASEAQTRPAAGSPWVRPELKAVSMDESPVTPQVLKAFSHAYEAQHRWWRLMATLTSCGIKQSTCGQLPASPSTGIKGVCHHCPAFPGFLGLVPHLTLPHALHPVLLITVSGLMTAHSLRPVP